jgi:hypothetical protein
MKLGPPLSTANVSKTPPYSLSYLYHTTVNVSVPSFPFQIIPSQSSALLPMCFLINLKYATCNL